MSSVQSGSSKQPLRRFVSAAPFPRDIFSYTVVTEPYPHEVLVPVPGATVRSCPAGRVLRESGKKLYPGVNKGVKTYMVGVIDTQSGISGFIDPNSPLFALYSTDLPAVMKDGRDPGPQGKVDVGPPLYTNGNMYVAQNAKIDGTLRVNISYTNDANMETAGFSTMTGADLLAEELTVSSLKGGDLAVSTIGALNIAASTIQTGCIVGVKGFIDNIDSVNIITSTIVASTIASEILIVQAAVLSSFGGVNGGATNFAATTGLIQDLTVSTFKACESLMSTLTVSSVVSGTIDVSTLIADEIESDDITVSTLNASTIESDEITVSTLNTDVFNLNEMNVSRLNASTIDSDEITVSTLTADEIESDDITVSTLNASTIESDEITVSTLTADEIESDDITVSTLNASTIESDEITVSTLTADEIESDDITVSTLNASTIESDEITVSTLTADEIESDDITVSTLNASTIDSDEITVSTLHAEDIESDEISVSTLHASTIDSDEITVSTLNAEDINVDDLNVSTIEFSTMNGGIIEADEINVDSLHTSSISSAGSIISNRQIRAVGPSGQRDPLDGSDPLIDLDIALGPFLYIAGNGDNVVTCTNFRFCDQLYLQTSGTGELTFSTGFGVSSITMEKANGMINFICDGFHMIELGRTKWAHTF